MRNRRDYKAMLKITRINMQHREINLTVFGMELPHSTGEQRHYKIAVPRWCLHFDSLKKNLIL